MTKREIKAAHKMIYRSTYILARTSRAPGTVVYTWLNQAAKARKGGDKMGCVTFLTRARAANQAANRTA